MFKKLNDFKKRFNKLKTVVPQTNENKVLNPKVLDNVGDLFNELYYVYKDKYNEEKDGLNTKNLIKKIFCYEKLRLTDDYQYESEEAKEQQTSKKELLKKPTEEDESDFNEWFNKKETNINSEIFQRLFKFQRPSDMFKLLYKTNNKKKNKELVNMIKSGIIDSKNEINEDEKEAEKLDRILKLLMKLLILITKFQYNQEKI